MHLDRRFKQRMEKGTGGETKPTPPHRFRARAVRPTNKIIFCSKAPSDPQGLLRAGAFWDRWHGRGVPALPSAAAVAMGGTYSPQAEI